MVVSLAACGSSNDKGSSADTDTFKIGGIGPTTGDNAIYGTAVKNGIQLAVDEINAAGGINGKQIEYKFEDDQSDAEKSVNAYNTLKDWGMQMLIGTTTSTPCTAVVEESHNDNLFQLTPSATAVESIQYDNAFRMCFSDPNQGSASADYIADNNLANDTESFEEADAEELSFEEILSDWDSEEAEALLEDAEEEVYDESVEETYEEEPDEEPNEEPDEDEAEDILEGAEEEPIEESAEDVVEADAEEIYEEEPEDEVTEDTPILSPDIQRLIDEIEGAVPAEESLPEEKEIEKAPEEPHENMGEVTESLRLDDLPEEDEDLFEDEDFLESEDEEDEYESYEDDDSEEDEYESYEDDDSAYIWTRSAERRSGNQRIL